MKELRGIIKSKETDMKDLINELIKISKEAGKEILDVYSSYISVEYKGR